MGPPILKKGNEVQSHTHFGARMDTRNDENIWVIHLFNSAKKILAAFWLSFKRILDVLDCRCSDDNRAWQSFN